MTTLDDRPPGKARARGHRPKVRTSAGLGAGQGWATGSGGWGTDSRAVPAPVAGQISLWRLLEFPTQRSGSPAYRLHLASTWPCMWPAAGAGASRRYVPDDVDVLTAVVHVTARRSRGTNLFRLRLPVPLLAMAHQVCCRFVAPTVAGVVVPRRLGCRHAPAQASSPAAAAGHLDAAARCAGGWRGKLLVELRRVTDSRGDSQCTLHLSPPLSLPSQPFV